MDKPFFLVVSGDRARQGGCGKKYTDIDEATQRAIEYLTNEPQKYPHGICICAPVKRIKLQRPPVTITEVDPKTGEEKPTLP